jgi:hypothetical protein
VAPDNSVRFQVAPPEKSVTGNRWREQPLPVSAQPFHFLLYQMPGSETGQDLQTQFDEQDGTFFPDGKWVA